MKPNQKKRYFEGQLEKLNGFVRIHPILADHHQATFITDGAIDILKNIYKTGEDAMLKALLNAFKKSAQSRFKLIFECGQTKSIFNVILDKQEITFTPPIMPEYKLKARAKK